MTIAVLANGPSLPEYWSEDLKQDYDIVIGVNTAAWVYPVDIWVVLDPAVVELGLPKIEANGIPIPSKFATHKNFKRQPEGTSLIELPWYNKGSKHLPTAVLKKHGIKQCNFTFPNALYLASLLAEGDPVHVYGMDITTANDFQEKWGDRSGSRWIREFPWIIAAWQPGWVIHSNAAPIIRDCLFGKIPFSTLLATLEKYEGGQHPRKMRTPEEVATRKRLAKLRGQA